MFDYVYIVRKVYQWWSYMQECGPVLQHCIQELS